MRRRGSRLLGPGGGVVAALLVLGACRAVPPRLPRPLTAEEYNDLGVARAARGEWKSALDAFEAAVTGRPRWGVALRNRGDARLALGDLDGALASYEQAWRAVPGDPVTANNLAWALLQHGERWPEAEALVRQALAGGPARRGFYLDTLGLLRVRQHAYQEALMAFQEALEEPPGERPARATVLEHAALALEGLGDTVRATRCRTLAAAPDDLGSQNTLC